MLIVLYCIVRCPFAHVPFVPSLYRTVGKKCKVRDLNIEEMPFSSTKRCMFYFKRALFHLEKGHFLGVGNWGGGGGKCMPPPPPPVLPPFVPTQAYKMYFFKEQYAPPPLKT